MASHIRLDGAKSERELPVVENEVRKRRAVEEAAPVKDTIAPAHKDKKKMVKKDRVQPIEGLDESQKEVFLEIYRKMDGKTLIGLVVLKSEIEKLAELVKNVPPLSFLTFIKNHGEMKELLSKSERNSLNWYAIVRESSPWRKTVSDFKDKMILAKKVGLKDLKNFLEKLNDIQKKDVEGFIKEERFEHLLKYFISEV